MSEPRSHAQPHPDNCKLRLAFLADCRANGMAEHRVRQRYSTTEHLIRQAGDKPLWKYSIKDLNQLLSDTRALSQDRLDKPLSRERLRKIFLHARELMGFAIAMRPKRFKQHPRHLKNLQVGPVVTRIDTTRRPYYTLDEMKQIAQADFSQDWVLQRAQAMACLQFNSGMRIGALVTLPLQGLNLEALTVRQDPSLGVKTKFGKAATTALLGIPELLQPIRVWCQALAEQVSLNAKVYAVFDDSVMPARPTDQAPGAGRAKNLNDDYAKLCMAVGLPYRSSHAFRHGHILFCVSHCHTPAEFLAVSQNVMHADVKMTAHYGAQGLRAVRAVYAHLADLGQVAHTANGEGEGRAVSIESAVSALTEAAKNSEIPAPQRELLRRLGMEIFSRLTQ